MTERSWKRKRPVDFKIDQRKLYNKRKNRQITEFHGSGGECRRSHMWVTQIPERKMRESEAEKHLKS